MKQGTWQFMSVDMLLKRAKMVEVDDDLESFFYVILYSAARYLKSNITDVGAFIEGFFDSYEVHDGRYLVGATKYSAITNPHGIKVPASQRPKPLLFS